MKYLKNIMCLVLCMTTLFLSVACGKNNGDSSGGNNSSGGGNGGNVQEAFNLDEYVPSFLNVNLVANKTTDYTILLPQNSTSSEEYAASIIIDVIKNSTGATISTTKEGGSLPVKYISIGDTNAAKSAGIDVNSQELGMGGFVLKTVGNNIYVNSDTENGKINGSIILAEKNFGFMYYCEDEVLYVKADTVKVGSFDLTYRPSFDGRNAFSYDTVYNHQNASMLKVNSLTSSWDEKYGEAGLWSTLHDMSNVFQLLYVKDYYNAHPEWFYINPAYANTDFTAMSDNDCYSIIQKQTQLCYTEGLYNDEVGGMFDTFVTNLKEYVLNEPTASLFMLGMGDNEQFCNCDRCKEDIATYKRSGVMLRFVNKVAREIKRWLKEESGTPNREVNLVAFAYLTVMEPPVKYVNRQPQPIDETVVAEDNVCIRIAPLVNANFYWPINDKDHNTFMANNIDGWSKITSKFTIWDYRVYYHNVVAPYPYWNTIKTNLEIYKDMNVIDVYHQGIAQTSGVPFGRLDDYIRSRLLYNLEADVRKLTDDFINAYYKQAAPYIKEYIAFLQSYYATTMVDAGYSGSVYTNVFTTNFWSKEALLAIRAIFDKAYASIENLPEEEYEKMKGRIDVESRFYRFGLLELYSSSFTKAEIAVMIEEWEDANVFNPILQNEVRVDISTKVDEWKNLLK